MSKRTILILILTVLWFWLCHYRYTCVHKQVCYGCAPDTSQEVPLQKNYGPLTFNANSATAITTDRFTAFKDSILKLGPPDGILEIIGYYYPGEQAPSGFDNMGLARADQARELFAKDIRSERIRLLGQLRTGDAPSNPFASAGFSWKVIDVAKSEVVKTADGANIYFPTNSAQKEVDPDIDDYLKQVAERVKLSDEKINLTGHTDNVGNPASNQKLGMDRAISIRNVLRSYGVPNDRITTVSKGESQPFTTNDTEEGRHQNRRVELTISQ